MNIKNVTVKDGAIFVADVHYKKGDDVFLHFLEDLNKNPPPQLFLLGDIFHLLLPFDFLVEYNKKAIFLIDSISQKTEVYFTYGNHDFLIDEIFENVVFADVFLDEKKSIYITHGDENNQDFLYNIYVKIIRNKIILNTLNLVTLNILNNYLIKKILKKSIKCNKILNFKEKVLKKIADIGYNTIIEGHFHQNVCFEFDNKTYCNLGAFYCDRSYYQFEDYKLKELKYGGKNIKSRLK